MFYPVQTQTSICALMHLSDQTLCIDAFSCVSLKMHTVHFKFMIDGAGAIFDFFDSAVKADFFRWTTETEANIVRQMLAAFKHCCIPLFIH